MKKLLLITLLIASTSLHASLLHQAVRNNSHLTAKILIVAGWNVDEKDEHNLTPLQVGIINDADLPLIDLLLDSEASLVLTNNHGHTALHLAACFSKFPIISTLIQTASSRGQRKSVLSARDNFGETPSGLAKKCHRSFFIPAK